MLLAGQSPVITCDSLSKIGTCLYKLPYKIILLHNGGCEGIPLTSSHVSEADKLLNCKETYSDKAVAAAGQSKTEKPLRANEDTNLFSESRCYNREQTEDFAPYEDTEFLNSSRAQGATAHSKRAENTATEDFGVYQVSPRLSGLMLCLPALRLAGMGTLASAMFYAES